MADPEIYKGDVGAIIRLTQSPQVRSLSGATTLKLKLQAPSRATKEFDATVNDTYDMQYITTSASDLDEAGIWTVQGYAELSGWSGHSSEAELRVGSTIEVST